MHASITCVPLNTHSSSRACFAHCIPPNLATVCSECDGGRQARRHRRRKGDRASHRCPPAASGVRGTGGRGRRSALAAKAGRACANPAGWGMAPRGDHKSEGCHRIPRRYVAASGVSFSPVNFCPSCGVCVLCGTRASVCKASRMGSGAPPRSQYSRMPSSTSSVWAYFLSQMHWTDVGIPSTINTLTALGKFRACGEDVRKASPWGELSSDLLRRSAM